MGLLAKIRSRNSSKPCSEAPPKSKWFNSTGNIAEKLALVVPDVAALLGESLEDIIHSWTDKNTSIDSITDRHSPSLKRYLTPDDTIEDITKTMSQSQLVALFWMDNKNNFKQGNYSILLITSILIELIALGVMNVQHESKSKVKVSWWLDQEYHLETVDYLNIMWNIINHHILQERHRFQKMVDIPQEHGSDINDPTVHCLESIHEPCTSEPTAIKSTQHSSFKVLSMAEMDLDELVKRLHQFPATLWINMVMSSLEEKGIVEKVHRTDSSLWSLTSDTLQSWSHSLSRSKDASWRVYEAPIHWNIVKRDVVNGLYFELRNIIDNERLPVLHVLHSEFKAFLLLVTRAYQTCRLDESMKRLYRSKFHRKKAWSVLGKLYEKGTFGYFVHEIKSGLTIPSSNTLPSYPQTSTHGSYPSLYESLSSLKKNQGTFNLLYRSQSIPCSPSHSNLGSSPVLCQAKTYKMTASEQSLDASQLYQTS